MKKRTLCILAAAFFFLNSYGQKIKASYAPAVFNEPFTGYVIAYLSKENKSPKDGAIGFENIPCYRIQVKDVKPGATVMFDDNATSYPVTLSDMERGDYYIQIVWDRNLGDRSIGNSAGNLYNTTEKIHIGKDSKAIFNIVATKTIAAAPAFKETEFVKELKVPSALLSTFHNKSITVNAAVILPKEYYTAPERRFPVLFNVFGYGGDYHRYSGNNDPAATLDTIPVIKVILDGNCPLGHSVYANSDNNGPWGDAFTSEFIPQLEKQYRCNGARLLTGHSSGGWTVLWLQTQYPDVFNACWSSAPDPVDFRSFQKINLYEDRNMFYGKDSALNLVATVAGSYPWVAQKTIYQAEHVVYRGEQMHSFDAVFSSKGSNGLPQPVCDSKTGVIDPAVVAHWKKYDISLNLRKNWEQLKPVLDGKVRISVGTGDNFLLNHAVTILETEMKKFNANFRFAYYPGDHFTVFTPEYRKDGYQFLARQYMEWLAKSGVKK
ncbi:MAG: alpha/beta hydrolase-fold protein [Ferruginibacter sp.]